MVLTISACNGSVQTASLQCFSVIHCLRVSQPASRPADCL